jgi:hypothetical protein
VFAGATARPRGGVAGRYLRNESFTVRRGVPVRPGGLLPQVYAQGALRADREGWSAQARKPSLDAALSGVDLSQTKASRVPARKAPAGPLALPGLLRLEGEFVTEDEFPL